MLTPQTQLPRPHPLLPDPLRKIRSPAALAQRFGCVAPDDDENTRQITLPRRIVQNLALRYIDRQRNAASEKSARIFGSYSTLLLALLQGDAPYIELRGTLAYFRDLTGKAGDNEAAFEVGRQLGVD